MTVLALSLLCSGVTTTFAGDRYMTEARMKTIIFPELDFRSIAFDKVIAFFQEQSREQDPKKKGINLLLKLDKDRNPAITLKLGKTSMHKALQLVTGIAEYRWRFIGSMLVIEPIPPEELEK